MTQLPINQQPTAQAISLNPDSFEEGGFPEGNYLIIDSRFAIFDYDGKADKPAVTLKWTMLSDLGVESTQHYSAGSTDRLTISTDENSLIPLGSNKGVNKSTNLAFLITELLSVGFPANLVQQGANVFTGLYAYFEGKAQPRRTGLDVEGAAARMIAVPSVIHNLPGVASLSPQAGRIGQAAGVGVGGAVTGGVPAGPNLGGAPTTPAAPVAMAPPTPAAPLAPPLQANPAAAPVATSQVAPLAPVAPTPAAPVAPVPPPVAAPAPAAPLAPAPAAAPPAPPVSPNGVVDLYTIAKGLVDVALSQVNPTPRAALSQAAINSTAPDKDALVRYIYSEEFDRQLRAGGYVVDAVQISIAVN